MKDGCEDGLDNHVPLRKILPSAAIKVESRVFHTPHRAFVSVSSPAADMQVLMLPAQYSPLQFSRRTPCQKGIVLYTASATRRTTSSKVKLDGRFTHHQQAIRSDSRITAHPNPSHSFTNCLSSKAQTAPPFVLPCLVLMSLLAHGC